MKSCADSLYFPRKRQRASRACEVSLGSWLMSSFLLSCLACRSRQIPFSLTDPLDKTRTALQLQNRVWPSLSCVPRQVDRSAFISVRRRGGGVLTTAAGSRDKTLPINCTPTSCTFSQALWLTDRLFHSDLPCVRQSHIRKRLDWRSTSVPAGCGVAGCRGSGSRTAVLSLAHTSYKIGVVVLENASD